MNVWQQRCGTHPVGRSHGLAHRWSSVLLAHTSLYTHTHTHTQEAALRKGVRRTTNGVDDPGSPQPRAAPVPSPRPTAAGTGRGFAEPSTTTAATATATTPSASSATASATSDDVATLRESRDRALDQIRNLLVTLRALADVRQQQPPTKPAPVLTLFSICLPGPNQEKQQLKDDRLAAVAAKDAAVAETAALRTHTEHLAAQVSEAQRKLAHDHRAAEAKLTELGAR